MSSTDNLATSSFDLPTRVTGRASNQAPGLVTVTRVAYPEDGFQTAEQLGYDTVPNRQRTKAWSVPGTLGEALYHKEMAPVCF